MDWSLFEVHGSSRYPLRIVKTQNDLLYTNGDNPEAVGKAPGDCFYLEG